MPTSCDRALNRIWISWFLILAFLWWRVLKLQVMITENPRWSIALLVSSPHVITGGDHRLRQKVLCISWTYELHRAWSTVEISNDPTVQISSRSHISRFLWWRISILQFAIIETPRWSLAPLASSPHGDHRLRQKEFHNFTYWCFCRALIYRHVPLLYQWSRSYHDFSTSWAFFMLDQWSTILGDLTVQIFLWSRISWFLWWRVSILQVVNAEMELRN